MPLYDAKLMEPASWSGIFKNAVFAGGILRDTVLNNNIIIAEHEVSRIPATPYTFPLRFSGRKGGGGYSQGTFVTGERYF